MNIFGLIIEDWKNIPQNVRYYILAGVTLLLVDWASVHMTRNYTLFGKDFHEVFFNIGVCLILLGLLMILVKQVYMFWKLTKLRAIYPLDKLNESFSLLMFEGRMILFDKKGKVKKAYHVETSATATDLGFWGFEQDVPLTTYKKAVEHELEIGEPINVKVVEYKYSGTINTRR